METTREEGSLYTRFEGSLAILEFGHPASNSLNSVLLDRICRELEALSSNARVSALLIQSEGDRAFCAGASFDELLEVSTPEQSKKFFSGFARLINSMRTCQKPIVGKVQGKAVGGGVGLIAACDYVMASDKASLRLSELGIGIAPLVIAPAVARKAGVSGLAEMALAPSEWKSAYWAKERGLFSKVFESRASLDKESEFFAHELSTHSPEALKLLKQALWEGTEHWGHLLTDRAAMTGKLALSETAQKTIADFKKKT
ncbi:MAG: enoyl-CoA hydratase/isomerase family protein [Robiginitalea sp.]|uniref:enoyl-CoA hydratase/isomerase family protein n=2 Tax=Robiginitalea sp. TaxID=1902411 RepID=UPI003C74FACB